MYKLIAQHYNRKETGYSFPFVYLHGKLEEINGYDIVSKEKDEVIPFGIHAVIVNVECEEYKATLFTWDSRSEERLKHEEQKKKAFFRLKREYVEEPRWSYQKGLIVLKGDKQALKDAYIKYKRREFCV